jgi:phosphoglycerate dehydrogenase-like enzyme
MPKVLIAPSTLAGVKATFLETLTNAGFELAFPPRATQLTEDELLRDLRGSVAALAGSEPYTRRVLQASPELRVIARVGVGFDAVDVAAATAQGVAVTITPGTNQDAVAEHTFALILALAKDLTVQHNALKSGRWDRRTTLPLRGRSLGVVGLGRIGKAVAVRGECFGMPLLAYEPYPDQEFVARHKIKLLPLEQLLAQADFISLHVPLAPESKYLICKKTLALMKPTAFLINTARGGLVCEADLLEALKAKRIAGAGLDVFEVEPATANPLFALDNVVLTPHAAGVDLRSRDDMAQMAAESVVQLLRGQWPAQGVVVNPEVRPKFQK